METQLLTHPAEPVVDDDKSYGGYAEIARMLNKQHPDRERPYSRQLVQRWFTHRDYNKFPEPHQVKTKSGLVRPKFKLHEVDSWHRKYRDTRGGNPPIETIPIYVVDSKGNLVLNQNL